MRARQGWQLSGLGVAALMGLLACGGGSTATSTSTSGAGGGTAQSTVNLVVTDTPSTAITVLSFQIQITGAVLQPGSVSLLPKPITVDLAQLVSDSGLLASTVIDSTTFTSLDLSFANPQVTLQNNSAATLNLAGQPCAVGAVCTFTPVLNSASLTISNGVFPLTLTASATTGLNLDLSIPDLLQSDLSVTFADGNSVNLSLLGTGPVRIDDVLATVTAVDGAGIHVTTAFGDSLVLNGNSSSHYAYPTSICTTSGIACVTSGQIVAVDASLGGSGSLTVDSLSYIGAATSSLTKGLVLASTAGISPSAQILLQRNVNASSLSPGQIATIAFAADSSYAVATAAYPSVPNATFGSPTDLLPGQEIIVDVGSDLVTGSHPTFTASNVRLQSTQVIGDIASVDTAGASLMIDSLSGLFTASGPHIETLGVQTDADTTLVGLDSLSAVMPGELIAAKGPLLNVAGSAPVVAATQVRSRQ